MECIMNMHYEYAAAHDGIKLKKLLLFRAILILMRQVEIDSSQTDVYWWN